MLDAYVIAELLRIEREREEAARPELRIEIEPPMPMIERMEPEEEKSERGVIIIDLLG